MAAVDPTGHLSVGKNANHAAHVTNDHSSEHAEQVRSYLRFFRNRLEEQLKEIDATFSDCKDMRLLEDVYTLSDVTNILDGVRDVVKSNVRADTEKQLNQTALFLRLLYLQAEGQKARLKINTSVLDDEALLSGIERLALEGETPPPAKRLQALTGTVDVKLVTQIKDLEESNERVQSRFEKLQEQYKAAQSDLAAMREAKEMLAQQLDATKRDLTNLRSSNTSAQQAEIDALRRQLAEVEATKAAAVGKAQAEAKEARDALQGKINEAPQFKELRRMVQVKNEQIKELRKQLEAAGISPAGTS